VHVRFLPEIHFLQATWVGKVAEIHVSILLHVDQPDLHDEEKPLGVLPHECRWSKTDKG
jgi:hypothetical protein